MSAETKTYEDKMTGVINHLVKEHATIRRGAVRTPPSSIR